MNQQLRPSVVEAQTRHDALTAQPLYPLCSKARELGQHPVSEGAAGPEKFYF